jgi:hypothetical protein
MGICYTKEHYTTTHTDRDINIDIGKDNDTMTTTTSSATTTTTTTNTFTGGSSATLLMTIASLGQSLASIDNACNSNSDSDSPDTPAYPRCPPMDSPGSLAGSDENDSLEAAISRGMSEGLSYGTGAAGYAAWATTNTNGGTTNEGTGKGYPDKDSDEVSDLFLLLRGCNSQTNSPSSSGGGGGGGINNNSNRSSVHNAEERTPIHSPLYHHTDTRSVGVGAGSEETRPEEWGGVGVGRRGMKVGSRSRLAKNCLHRLRTV